jgi:hypothetical protein
MNSGGLPAFGHRTCVALAFALTAGVAVPALAQDKPRCDKKLGELRLPAVSELLDSAWAYQYLSLRAKAAGGTTVVILHFRPDGTIAGVDGPPSMPPAMRQELADSVRPRVLVQQRLPTKWTIMLGMGWWTSGEVEILPVTVTCEPALQNRGEIRSAIAALRETHGLQAYGDRGADLATFQIAILTDGSVAHAQFLRSTGRPQVDHALREIVLRLRFTPALVGSEPVRLIRQQRIALTGPR